MTVTLLGHFWNEELLLPFWLKHHRTMFDHGILVDYHSTDRSVEIIRELVPDWELRTTHNRHFDAKACDAEMRGVERERSGWKIVLNTTEFLLSEDLPAYCNYLSRWQPGVTGVWPMDFILVDPLGVPQLPLRDDVPFLLQRHWGYWGQCRRSRLLHCHPGGRYIGAGRHKSVIAPHTLNTTLCLAWAGFSPWPECISRKLLIQTRIPHSDRKRRLGWHHIKTKSGLVAEHYTRSRLAGDLWATEPDYWELCRLLSPST